MKILGGNFPNTPAYIACCEKCGLVFTDTEAEQKDFISYYKTSAYAPKYFDMFGEEETYDYYNHLLELITPYIKKESIILDIAGAWGELDEYLIKKGYLNVTDLDPNEDCIANARNKKINGILADSTDMKQIKDNSVDLVILNHALEHILNVEDSINELKRVLKYDGYVFLEIPNAEGYVSEESAPFNFLTYEHVLHMTMNDIANIAAKYGFKIIDKGFYYKKVSNYPSIYSIMKKGRNGDVQFSDIAEKSIKAYLEKSESSLLQFINPLKVSQEPLVLWGIGASTAILLEVFKECNVVQLVDRNPKRQGIEFVLNGQTHKIVAPDAVGNGTIVILSIPYRDSICKQIRNMGLDNPIVMLK
ncbi:class I SAM-dependent methyltransferase [Butyrivibrio proteoclasticus]|nr:class I SAM-dependent methyltransferase [Butyrivibrio proteoclasticus]